MSIEKTNNMAAEADDAIGYWVGMSSCATITGYFDSSAGITCGYLFENCEGPGCPVSVVYEGNLRFTNVTVPKGVTIDYASITLKTASSASSAGTPNLDIQAFDEDNSSQVADWSDHIGRSRTTANVAWNQTFSDNTSYETPDIKTVVQEIIDRASWASGNAMQFIISDNTYKWNGCPTGGADWVGFQADSSTNIYLHIHYSYLDIGLRVRTSSGTITIGAETLTSSHKVRIRKSATTYGIPLVATDDAAASGIRIYDGSIVKALPKQS